MRKLALFLSIVGFALGGNTSVQAQASGEIEQALDWLHTQQQPDGGFSNGFAPGSDAGTTADAVLAIVTGGDDPSAWVVEGQTPVLFLEAAAGAEALGPGLAAKLTLAAVAARVDARSFNGVDLIAVIEHGLNPETGLFGSGPFDSALALLALHAAGEPVPAEAAERLLAYRLADGSFSFNGDLTPGAGDSNTTALAVQALLATDRALDIQPSLGYLHAAQNADGGWTYQKPSAFGEETDANSTALAIQALLAAGEDLSGWNDPMQALRRLQVPSGAFIFNAATSAENLLATVQAIPALSGVDYTQVGSITARPQAPADVGLDMRLVAGALIALTVLLVGGALLTRRSSRGA